MKPTRVPISPRVQELKKQKKKSYRARLLFRAILGVCFIVVLIFFFNIKELQVQGVSVSHDLKDKDQIEMYMQERLTEKFFYVISKKSILFFPKKHFKKDLATTFPILETVDLSIKNHELIVSGDERLPVYMYCGETPVLTGFGQSDCELVDKTGFAFRKAPVFSGPVYFTFYINGASASLLGTQILTTETLQHLVSFKDGLKEIGITPTGIILGTDDTLTLLLSKKGGVAYGKIIFSETQSVESLLNDLRLVLQNEPLKSHILHPETIEYIDIRYRDKVYYKLK